MKTGARHRSGSSLSASILGNQPINHTMQTYKIVRWFNPTLHKQDRTIKTGLTEEQAQAHCKRPDTREDGVWFDCYVKE